MEIVSDKEINTTTKKPAHVSTKAKTCLYPAIWWWRQLARADSSKKAGPISSISTWAAQCKSKNEAGAMCQDRTKSTLYQQGQSCDIPPVNAYRLGWPSLAVENAGCHRLGVSALAMHAREQIRSRFQTLRPFTKVKLVDSFIASEWHPYGPREEAETTHQKGSRCWRDYDWPAAMGNPYLFDRSALLKQEKSYLVDLWR